MSTISVIMPADEPDVVQLYAVGHDASVAAIAASSSRRGGYPSMWRGSCATTSA